MRRAVIFAPFRPAAQPGKVLRASLKKSEDFGAVFGGEMDLLLRLHLVEHRRPVLALAGLVDAMAGGALGAVEPLAFRHGPRRRGAARCGEKDECRKPHRLNPSTERISAEESVSPSPMPTPAPSWIQNLLVATETEGPTNQPRGRAPVPWMVQPSRATRSAGATS